MKRRKLTKDERTGTYYARIQVNGVRKKFYFGTNRRDAERELRQLEDDIETGNKSFAALANVHLDKSQPQDIRIADLIKRYMQWVQVNRAKGTYLSKRDMLQPFLDRYGDCMVSDLNHTTLAQYYAWARKHRGRSANGGNRHFREVKTLIRWGEDMDICICPVRRFPAIREAPAKTKKFTDAELPLLLDHAAPDFRDMITFGLLTGLRPNELRNLRYDHVRRIGENTCIVLEKHKASMTAQIAQPRCVPLSLQAVEIVERQQAAHPGSPIVFLNAKGNPYTAGGFRQRLERACVRAGLEKRSPYALRHYFGTKQAGSGLNQAILAQLMGHTTIVTTTRYVAKVPDYHQQAVDVMQQALGSVLSKPVESIESEHDGKIIKLPPVRKTS